MTPGAIVILNGPSSSGKTAIAQKVRDRRGPSCAVLSIDQFYPSVHPARVNDWALYQSLTRILFASAAACAEEGFDVVVDSVFERRQCIEASLHALRHLRASYVGLTCPVPVLERRERERGDRPLGLAGDQNSRVHADCAYDLMLDTAQSSIETCAEQVLELFDAGQWTAQALMRERMIMA